jgi:uncharacterized protein
MNRPVSTPRQLRVVIDTNVLISAIVFRQGQLGWLREAWQLAAIKPIVSKETSAELLRVLSYEKFKLDAAKMQAALTSYLPYAEFVETENKSRPHLMQSRDPNDDMFLRLAYDGKAQVLISGDQDLLCLDDPMGKHAPFRILMPQAFKTQFNIL